jgi:ubiquitin-like 1-activating enzyme E1 B
MIGAGGIGCELLKNLVLTGFENIVILDLDTIDVSNLNRQFLFRSHHVGQPKALVARESILLLNPYAKIEAHHANIKEERFGLTFFEGFDLVMNALDNVAARRHVNRSCLAAGVPLIEAGTAKYEGQTYVIKKGVSACYECEAKGGGPKKYPMCTIRSTPELPVHCVFWAKELHKLLVGDMKTSYLFETDSVDSATAIETGGHKSVYMQRVLERPKAGDAASIKAYCCRVFEALFCDEIVSRLKVAPETYKTAKFKPRPLDLSLLDEKNASSSSSSSFRQREQDVLNEHQSAQIFLRSLESYFSSDEAASKIGSLEFNKDSSEDLDLVTASANLRAFTFGIQLQSRFQVKEIAGNIIPAIATTNAIVAGLEVTEALKILRGDDVLQSCRYFACNRMVSFSHGRRALLVPRKLDLPNKNCKVCCSLTVFIDTKTTSLRDLIDRVVKGSFAFKRPNISNDDGFDFIEERIDDDDDAFYSMKLGWLNEKLCNLIGGGIKDGTAVNVIDYGSSRKCQFSIRHRNEDEFDSARHPSHFEVVGDFNVLNEEELQSPPLPSEEEIKPKPKPADTVGQKRQRENNDVIFIDVEEPEQPQSKKGAVVEAEEIEIID